MCSSVCECVEKGNPFLGSLIAIYKQSLERQIDKGLGLGLCPGLALDARPNLSLSTWAWLEDGLLLLLCF